MGKVLILFMLVVLALFGCGGSNPGALPSPCPENEIVPCLTEWWLSWYEWQDQYGHYEYMLSDGDYFSYEGYLSFEIGLRWVKLAGVCDSCQHGTIYSMGRKVEGSDAWKWVDVDGTLSICGDMLSLSALTKEGQQVTEPKGR